MLQKCGFFPMHSWGKVCGQTADTGARPGDGDNLVNTWLQLENLFMLSFMPLQGTLDFASLSHDDGMWCQWGVAREVTHGGRAQTLPNVNRVGCRPWPVQEKVVGWVPNVALQHLDLIFGSCNRAVYPTQEVRDALLSLRKGILRGGKQVHPAALASRRHRPLSVWGHTATITITDTQVFSTVMETGHSWDVKPRLEEQTVTSPQLILTLYVFHRHTVPERKPL